MHRKAPPTGFSRPLSPAPCSFPHLAFIYIYIYIYIYMEVMVRQILDGPDTELARLTKPYVRHSFSEDSARMGPHPVVNFTAAGFQCMLVSHCHASLLQRSLSLITPEHGAQACPVCDRFPWELRHDTFLSPPLHTNQATSLTGKETQSNLKLPKLLSPAMT